MSTFPIARPNESVHSWSLRLARWFSQPRSMQPVEPQIVLLAHKTGKEGANTAGVLMFDPVLGVPVTTYSGKWEPLVFDAFLASNYTLVGHTHTEATITDLNKYTKQEVDGFLSALSAVYSPIKHLHSESEVYDLDKYTKLEVDTSIAALSAVYAPIAHTHPYAPLVHTHTEGNIIGLDKYTQAEVNSLLLGKLSNLLDDATPELGGPLNANSNSIDDCFSLGLIARAAAPADPATDSAIVWLSDTGDLMAKINIGGTIKTATLADWSTL